MDERTGEGSFVLDIDVLVFSVPFDGLLQPLKALHGGHISGDHLRARQPVVQRGERGMKR